ncbi:uncharacterized protein SPPG_02822 [Spizellomyces punctatus DAOM BR117]|uniref:J domain-containing protein n=1 Tax=Spizellomyces punctatus (strain DAOM BR117) TaxID=645134 RepID=A0A0L0HLP3_SPIPD|nr:uncharacterized protein SPPG_02822 [Spizellomyces punctatus DAOM BR117]KND02351.1 hypothetical protein SPPG_02822 [Spizellomyces punctatus DAOM BR117]|eukprot:XP_016610390.1 hypothetical protein SPPG_02822 [Spizellomyces punctatus DAOM BR117]
MSPYEVLGILPTATLEEVNQAFRRRALEWHPDRNLHRKEEAERVFKEIGEAYAIVWKKLQSRSPVRSSPRSVSTKPAQQGKPHIHRPWAIPDNQWYGREGKEQYVLSTASVNTADKSTTKNAKSWTRSVDANVPAADVRVSSSEREGREQESTIQPQSTMQSQQGYHTLDGIVDVQNDHSKEEHGQEPIPPNRGTRDRETVLPLIKRFAASIPPLFKRKHASGLSQSPTHVKVEDLPHFKATLIALFGTAELDKELIDDVWLNIEMGQSSV